MNDNFKKNLKLKTSVKKFLMPLVIIAILGLVIAGGYSLVRSGSTANSAGLAPSQVKTQSINLAKSFDLPTGLEGGKDNIQPLKITIRTAQLTNQITVGGRPRTAPTGGNYLMINLLIENNNPQKLSFKSRDIIRLIDPNNKKFAPSFYNLDVNIEGDSVKKDNVGFLVPDNQKEFKIQVGSLTGTKQILDLKFK